MANSMPSAPVACSVWPPAPAPLDELPVTSVHSGPAGSRVGANVRETGRVGAAFVVCVCVGTGAVTMPKTVSVCVSLSVKLSEPPTTVGAAFGRGIRAGDRVALIHDPGERITIPSP